MIDARIRTFLSVCRLGSMTRAAEERFITQPAVSKQIHSLETELDISLFDQQKRRLHLTPEGELFRHHAERLLALERAFPDALDALRGAPPRIRIGTTRTIGEFTLADVLPRMTRRFQDLDISVRVDNTEAILAGIDEGTLQFGVVEGLFDATRYQSRLLKKEPFCIICSPTHPLAHRQVMLPELLGETLIVREPGSGTRDITERALAGHNLSLSSFSRMREIGNVNLIKGFVQEELGISFLYRDAVRKELANHELADIRCPDLDILRAFYIVHAQDLEATEDIRRCWDHLIEAFPPES